MSQCYLIILSVLCIIVSIHPVLSLSIPFPSTCAIAEDRCSRDEECKQLLDNFNHKCQRVMHNPHREHCHENYADALNKLAAHPLGQAISICDCGEASLCKKERQYLKRACKLKHGEKMCAPDNITCFVAFNGLRNPPPEMHCKEAIANCLLDSCCRKAYEDFYYGEDCEFVLTHGGIGEQPSCSDACVALFDKLAESPHADDLLSYNCDDLGSLCTIRYGNYDSFCIDKPSSEDKVSQRGVTNKDDTLSTTRPDGSSPPQPALQNPPCLTSLLTCLVSPLCYAAFIDLYFSECKRSIYYMDDGPRPACTAACRAKINTLLQLPGGHLTLTCDCGPFGTLCSKLQDNIKHCLEPTKSDCLTAVQECLSDPACGKVFRQYLYGGECTNVLEYDGYSIPEPNCSMACVKTEEELRKQPEAKKLLYCDCTGLSPNICSQPRENFNRFCNECPDNYDHLAGPTTTTLVSNKVDCFTALMTCLADISCADAYTAFYNGPACHDVLFYTDGPEPTCSWECSVLHGHLRSFPEASALVNDCDCGVLGDTCRHPRQNFSNYCALDCTIAITTCKLDSDCRSILNKFMYGEPCRNVLYTENGTNPSCSDKCLQAHQEVMGHPLGKQIFSCLMQSTGTTLLSSKTKFCLNQTLTANEIDESCPATTDATTTPASPAQQPLCAMIADKCQTEPECLQLFDRFLYGKECRNVLYHTGDGRPTCYPDCSLVLKELTLHPLGDDYFTCDCGRLDHKCSDIHSNFFKYCAAPGINCSSSVNHGSCECKLLYCLDDSDCRAIYKNVFDDPACAETVAHIRGRSRTTIHCAGCLPPLRQLANHTLGFDMFACTCVSESCNSTQSLFKQACQLDTVLPQGKDADKLDPVLKQPQLCTEAETTCRAEEECAMLLNSYETACYNVLLFTGTGTGTRPACNLQCLFAYRDLIAHPTAQPLIDCDCDAAAHCAMARKNMEHLCAIPDNPDYPTGLNASSTCEVQIYECIGNDVCRRLLKPVADSTSCTILSSPSLTITNRELECRQCVPLLLALASDPKGVNMQTCSCAIDFVMFSNTTLQRHVFLNSNCCFNTGRIIDCELNMPFLFCQCY